MNDSIEAGYGLRLHRNCWIPGDLIIALSRTTHQPDDGTPVRTKRRQKGGANWSRHSTDKNFGIHDDRLPLYQFAERQNKLRMNLKPS
jgi:hypothetical protein